MSSPKNGLDSHIETEELSKKSNCSYYRICENIPAGIAVVDCEGNCYKVNSRLCKILGYTEPELLGTGFKELINFKELEINSWIQERKFRGALKFLNEQGHCLKKDGNEIWINISLSLVIDSENKLNFAVLLINDITEQKKADISFRPPEISFDLIYGNISDGVVINEQVGKFLEANPAICKKIGYTREEFLQKTVTEFIAPESSKIFAEKVRELYRNGQATVQITAICKSGDFLPVELNMWLIEYKGKQAIFSIVSDIKG
jgi:PAS domain S-box-containing protein